MANFKSNRGQDYPKTDPDHLNEKDPMVVKVPMDNVDFGARKGTIGKARSPESGGNNRLGIRHVDGKK